MGDDERQKKYIKVGMEYVTKVSKKILENLEGEEQEAGLENMRKIMKDYIRMEAEYSLSVNVLAKLRKGLDMETANMDRDIESDYKTLFEQELSKENLEESVLVEDPRYKQLERLISGEREGAGDGDLVLTGDTQTFLDPWKRTPIKDPLTNRKCGHTYEKATVKMLLSRSGKKPLKCPVVGCSNNNITEGDLYVDQEIKRKIMKLNRA